MASFIATVLTVALIAMVVMFVIRLLRRKSGGDQPAFAYGAAPQGRTPDIGSGLNQGAKALQGASFSSGAAVGQAVGIPADFDVTGFLRHAKTYFIRLQAAWDKADVNDIREFSTPEMFAELRIQLQERGASSNHTDVVSLDADLLQIETIGDDYLASVRFSGMIRETENAPAEPFAEVWNLSKPVQGSGGWVLAGIQQMS
jgi:predicted lipid-binding transport protein (Tim44 family)